MELKDFLLEFAGRTLNKPADELADALFQMSGDNAEEIKPDALDFLVSSFESHIQSIKGDVSKSFENGYGKGKAETAKQWEKRLREKAAVNSDKTGEDLIEEVISEISKKGDLDETKVKRHAAYLSLEKQMREQIEQLQAAKEQELTQLQTKFERKERWDRAKSLIMNEFISLNPDLPKDETKKQNQINWFLKEFEALDYQFENDQILILEGDKRKEDTLGHAYDLKRLVREKAEPVFEFVKQDNKGNAGNTNGVTPPKQQEQGPAEETFEQYFARRLGTN
jgi:hypothetical protein